MAVPRLRVPSASPGGSLRQPAGLGRGRALPPHVHDAAALVGRDAAARARAVARAMSSSLHALAATDELDLGAFLYAMRRLPAVDLEGAASIVVGQEAEVVRRPGSGGSRTGRRLEAPARRRRWYDAGAARWRSCSPRRRTSTTRSRRSSPTSSSGTSCTLLLRAAELPRRPRAGRRGRGAAAAPRRTGRGCARRGPTGSPGSSSEVARPQAQPAPADARRLAVGYARLTRRWWAPVRATLTDQGLSDRPMYFVSSNTHSLVNLRHGRRRGASEDEIVGFVESEGPDYLRDELERFRDGRTEGSWENFLYYGARLYYEAQPDDGPAWERRRRDERETGVTPPLLADRPARVGAGDRARQARPGAGWTRGSGRSTRERLARTPGVIVNIEYPLGLAAYNILREITTAHDTLRGVYVLGKAATLNADVGDVLISSVIHDEHSGSTYWLDNAFSFDDIAPYLVFGSGPGQPARGDGQVDVPAEPQLPRLLLPRGVHGGRDGGRPVLQRGLRDRRRRPLPGRARRSTSPSSRSTSGSSTTPLTRRTRRRARSARAGSPTTAWTRRTRRRWRSCGGSSRWRACWSPPRAPAVAT